MARTVSEIMNPHLLCLRQAVSAKDTVDMILEFGVTAVPVIDSDGRPTGVVSLRDLVRVGAAEAPRTSPATTIALGASVASVAETMATTGRRHLVVVDADGRAVGMVSTLDVVRALIGYPVKHPPAFLNRDPESNVWWSSDEVLEESSLGRLPEEPGVLLLVRGGMGRSEEVVAAEATGDVRSRVRELLGIRASRRSGSLRLERILGQDDHLRIRHAVVADMGERSAIARRLQERIENAPPPNAT
jgi:CBS domain-containing protein